MITFTLPIFFQQIININIKREKKTFFHLNYMCNVFITLTYSSTICPYSDSKKAPQPFICEKNHL